MTDHVDTNAFPIFQKAADSILQGDRCKNPPHGQRMAAMHSATIHEDLPMVICKDKQNREANITIPLHLVPQGVPVTPASVHDAVYVAMLEGGAELANLPPLQ